MKEAEDNEYSLIEKSSFRAGDQEGLLLSFQFGTIDIDDVSSKFGGTLLEIGEIPTKILYEHMKMWYEGQNTDGR